MQKKPIIIIISIIILLSLAIIFQDLLFQIPENDNEEKQVIPPAIEWGGAEQVNPADHEPKDEPIIEIPNKRHIEKL